MPEDSFVIGAVVYRDGDGGRADAILSEVAGNLRAQGGRLAGAVQHNTANPTSCRCDMTLEDLATGRLVSISEDRGPEARGCHLDTAALEDIVGLVSASLEQDIDLLIVNKFGKREGEGAGFRSAIELALTRNIPILVAVSSNNLTAWKEFAGEFEQCLPLDQSAIADWCMRQQRSVEHAISA